MAARSGQVVEVRGDEVFAVFQSAAQAVRAALELQGFLVLLWERAEIDTD